MSDLDRERLLGPAQVEREGHATDSPASGKALALLGYLAVHHQPLTREHLASLLWLDKPADRGRANLSWLLHQLNDRLPGCLEASRHTVRFRRGPPYWLDLDAFADLLAQGDAADLAETVDLYEQIRDGELPVPAPYPIPPLPVRRHNLPVQPTPFVGREAEGAGIEEQGLGWISSIGSGKGDDTISSVMEGAWTPKPTRWDIDSPQPISVPDWVYLNPYPKELMLRNHA